MGGHVKAYVRFRPRRTIMVAWYEKKYGGLWRVARRVEKCTIPAQGDGVVHVVQEEATPSLRTPSNGSETGQTGNLDAALAAASQ